MSSCMYNYSIEKCRKTEFPHVKDAVYVDHAGSALYSHSQMTAVHQDLTTNLYGNPHSLNASSRLATDTVDQLRYRVLRFFNASPEEYSLIFTSGCTASLKIIADGFQFVSDESSSLSGTTTNETGASSEEGGVFCYLIDNHTSVQGMRESVAPRCSGIYCLDEKEFQAAIDDKNTSLSKSTTKKATNGKPSLKLGAGDVSSSVDPASYNLSSSSLTASSLTASSSRVSQSLVAFPAQSNFSGRKYPLRWVKDVQTKGLTLDDRSAVEGERWFVLLDAAGYVSTSRLDLSLVSPDFVTLSFYKIFGYPTGLGALIVHKRAWSTLNKTYFGGGTVAMSTAKERFHVFRSALHERFEDGTVSFLDIISLRHGLDTIQRLAGGMEAISLHVFSIAQYFYRNLVSLRHGNGRPFVQVYGDITFDTSEGQGGIVTFNILRSDGSFVGFAEVDKFAQLHDVHLRTGCFCNIGACQMYLGISSALIKKFLAAGHTCGDNMDLIDGKPTGAVRISFGYMNTISDARACLRFLADSFLENPSEPLAFPFPDWYDIETESNDVSQVQEVKRREGLNPEPVVNGLKHDNNTKDVDVSALSAASISKTCSPSVRKVTDIFLYPVKSCGAFRVTEWEMGTKGLLYDREWILVSDSGVTIGQKRQPNICMLGPSIDLVSRKLTLNFPGMSPFELPLDQDQDFEAVSSLCTNKVCGDRVNTFDCGDAVSDWLSDAIGVSGLRLLRQQSDDTRRSKLKDREASGDASEAPKLSMANESQLLLISRASIRELQVKMKEVIDTSDAGESKMATAPEDVSEENLMLRFRGNLVIDGGHAFEEEDWTSVLVGEEKLVCQGPCARCQMICMDQETSVKTREPLRSLSVWRGKKAPFGIHSRLLPRTDGSQQIVRVGDVITV